MKKVILFLFLLITCNIASSQIYVKDGSFRKIDGFVMMDKNDHYDMNDSPMALIKISTENISAAERRSPPATLRRFLSAQEYMAKAAPGRPKIISGNLPVIKRQASTEKRVTLGEASSAKKIFCAP